MTWYKVGNASIQIEYSFILFSQNNGLPYDILPNWCLICYDLIINGAN